MRILLAEDEKDLNNILVKKLTDEGYSVDSCLNGAEALSYLESTEYDGAILDIMMPEVDGLTVLSRIRAQGNKVPILLLTARDSVQDKVRGLDAGANDYLIKPFSLAELMARLRVLTRSGFGASDNILRVKDLTMNLSTHRVTRGDREIILSAKEYALLEYLMLNAGTTLSREKIEDHIWNFDYEGGTNVVDVYIRYLRKKIDEGFDEKLITTVRGVGYVIK